MAMQDQILFTGRELNLEIPKFSEMNAASESVCGLKLNREEDLQQDLQKELRDNMDADIETFTSNHIMKQQADMYKAFMDKWTLRRNSGGTN